MKLKHIVIIIATVAFFVGCKNKKSELISQFENSIEEMSFSDQGVKYTGKKFTIQERMSHYKAPGLSVAVIDNFKTDWEKCYGFLEAGNPEMVEPGTIFQAGSVSKFVSAVIVMHYVDKGMIDLDTDINQYLKTWEMPKNEFNKNIDITLRHLLTHQSGLPSTNFSYEEGTSPTIQQVLNAEKPAINKPAIPEFVPGSRFSYSNVGYVVVQLVLEDHLGKTFNEIAQEALFEPLGMSSSSFNHPLKKSMQSREAKPHSADGKAHPVDQDYVGRAQGGLMTTTEDMSLFMIELMKTYNGKSEKVMTQETLKEMFSKQVIVPASAAFGFEIGMGIGVFVDGEGENLSFMHPGHSHPGSVFIVIGFPGLGEGMALGCNGTWGDRVELEVLASLVDMYNWPSGRYFE